MIGSTVISTLTNHIPPSSAQIYIARDQPHGLIPLLMIRKEGIMLVVVIIVVVDEWFW